jgi:hypothetical protein
MQAVMRGDHFPYKDVERLGKGQDLICGLNKVYEKT